MSLMWTFKIQAEMSVLRFVVKILSINELEADNLVGNVMVGMYPADKMSWKYSSVNFRSFTFKRSML